MLTGWEIGGGCTSGIHMREANAEVSALSNIGGSAWTRTEVGCSEKTWDELLITGE